LIQKVRAVPSKPDRASCRCARLRTSSSAPFSISTATAIWQTTSADSARPRPRPASARDEPASASAGSDPDAIHAGAAPNTSVVASVSAAVKRSTVGSIDGAENGAICP
jgi:hypothetical protein